MRLRNMTDVGIIRCSKLMIENKVCQRHRAIVLLTCTYRQPNIKIVDFAVTVVSWRLFGACSRFPAYGINLPNPANMPTSGRYRLEGGISAGVCRHRADVGPTYVLCINVFFPLKGTYLWNKCSIQSCMSIQFV